MSQDLDALEFKQILYLGGRVSKKHKEFQMLASLGFTEAEQYQIFQFWKFLTKNGDASLEDIIEKAVVLIGRAKMLENTKELTRLSMILGDTRKGRKYGT